MEPKIAERVDKWLVENPERIMAALENAIQLGVAGCVQKQLDQRFENVTNNLGAAIQSIRQGLSSKGVIV